MITVIFLAYLARAFYQFTLLQNADMSEQSGEYEKQFILNATRLSCFIIYFMWESFVSKFVILLWHLLYVFWLLFILVINELQVDTLFKFTWNCLLVCFFNMAFEIVQVNCKVRDEFLKRKKGRIQDKNDQEQNELANDSDDSYMRSC